MEPVLIRIRDGFDRHGAMITAAVGAVGLVTVIGGSTKLLGG